MVPFVALRIHGCTLLTILPCLNNILFFKCSRQAILHGRQENEDRNRYEAQSYAAGSVIQNHLLTWRFILELCQTVIILMQGMEDTCLSVVEWIERLLLIR